MKTIERSVPITLIRKIIDLANCASKDETRIYLKSVCYSAKNKEFVATDGSFLTAYPYDLDIDDDLLIDVEDIQDLKLLLKKLGKVPDNYKVDFNIVYLNSALDSVMIKASRRTVFLNLITREYPNYKQVVNFKIKDDDLLEIAIDPFFLANIVKSLSVKKGKGIVLQFNKNKPLNPIKVISDNLENHSYSLLMPRLFKRGE